MVTLIFIFSAFSFSYRGLEPLLVRAHAGHTQGAGHQDLTRDESKPTPQFETTTCIQGSPSGQVWGQLERYAKKIWVHGEKEYLKTIVHLTHFPRISIRW